MRRRRMLIRYHSVAAEVDLQQAHEAPFGQAEHADGSSRDPAGGQSEPAAAQGRHGAPQPLISVLINNHNYGRYLKAAIDSALDQTYPAVEIVVVDDGSTDNSRELIAAYGGRVIPVLQANGGQGSAFNAGVAASRGDILCFLDAD